MDVYKRAGKIVYQKVIFVFLASCMALALAYTISKMTFDKMLDTVDSISTPNEKLRLVSKISRDILQLDQIQRSQLLLQNNTTTFETDAYPSYVDNSNTVFSNLDSLKQLFTNDQIQQIRIDSIGELLKERNKIFLSYIQIRKSLVDNTTFTKQIKNINELIQSSPKSDTVVTTQTTIKTTVPEEAKEEKDDRGFFAKLFGVKKKQPTPLETAEIIKEEYSVQVESINKKPEKAAKAKIDKAIQSLEQRQRLQNSTFNSRETELTIAGNILTNNIIDILYEVEEEAKIQMELDTKNAQITVNQSVSKISYILIASFIIMSILIYLILSDIRKANTYRLALEKSKEEAEYHSAAKQRFLSNMSHELRTPLQSIIGYTEQLKKSLIPDSNIEVIHHASEHLLQIVNEVLDYNRIISGKFIFQKETVLITDVVNEVTKTLQPLANQKKLNLTVEEQLNGSGYVLGDAFRLRQILFNLISNAIKFTNEGSIVVGVKAVDYGTKTDINLSVTDTGSGISDQDLDHIFDEFEQGENHESGENFGSGLGLSIVKTLIEAMDGTIKVKSKVDQGSTFSVHLSLMSSHKLEPQDLEDRNKEMESNDLGTVWIVDDDTFILDLCSTILRNNHIKHKIFSSPQALLDEPTDPQVSHILMDMRMPGLSGKELNHILTKRISKSVKTIAFTAQALPEERSKILSEGFHALLIKPFREAELLGILGLSPIEETQRNYSTDLDLGILPFIYEDPSELAKIINLFIKDTLSDLANLKIAIKEKNTIDSEILFHRLAGRTAQLGQEKIAFNLRKNEIDTRNGEIPELKDIIEIENQLNCFIEFLINKEKLIQS